MNWNQEKSVFLSKLCVIFFAALLAGLDIGCYWVVSLLLSVSRVLGGIGDGIGLMSVIYGCSIPAWVTLWSLWRILTRLGREQVFVEENVRDMRRTSWCCMVVAAVCLAGSWIWQLLLIPAAAAGFMGLIVRIVKNLLRQAVSMKDELDYTV